jgi:hypothetical protein
MRDVDEVLLAASDDDAQLRYRNFSTGPRMNQGSAS